MGNVCDADGPKEGGSIRRIVAMCEGERPQEDAAAVRRLQRERQLAPPQRQDGREGGGARLTRLPDGRRLLLGAVGFDELGQRQALGGSRDVRLVLALLSQDSARGRSRARRALSHSWVGKRARHIDLEGDVLAGGWCTARRAESLSPAAPTATQPTAAPSR